MTTRLLTCENLSAGYGASQVLFGLDFAIDEGEVIGLLGRNGMGKSTTIKNMVGVLKPFDGTLTWQGHKLNTMAPDAIARLGLAVVPEGRQCFPNLTVREHLVAFSSRRNGNSTPWTLERIYELFPRLAERSRHLGSQLSGGEQQMLAIGRALMNAPRLLMLDEPVEGLAPVIVEEIVAQLKTIKAAGVAILLVEQNLEVCTQLADRHYIIEQGAIAHEAGNAAFLADDAIKDRYLGVGIA